VTGKWDHVHTVDDYHDGPIRGVADLNGKPHAYECDFDEAKDDWTTTFSLTPIDEETFAMVKAKNVLWLRWREAFDRGETKIDTHPALPDDRPEYERLSRAIAAKLSSAVARTLKMNGEFRADQVSWSELKTGEET
jgi:hypothetical protein